jgi:hypothetical protein
VLKHFPLSAHGSNSSQTWLEAMVDSRRKTDDQTDDHCTDAGKELGEP